MGSRGGGGGGGAQLLIFSLGFVLLCFTSSADIAGVVAQKTWCVAKPSASNDVLSLNLNYACSQVSCAVIQKGGPCYYPDNLVSRAAVAMNLYYAANGRHPWNCYFNNSALVVQSDPSYGSCTYY
ncbi:hypothetical protein HU200_065454 [Digitaria exilis]|uniref:X8 domain-containing protein n=1 Tax=Digitaria exilis TaxID=1010633 RepID=A0A835A0R0_9POAL|nr:hypothetical protein HU200_066812 [Digitaria exilis]KAF8647191.1 hypothetical protein HU200_065454 [Digitaria exilis]